MKTGIYKKWLRRAVILAVVYQAIIVLHVASALLFPEKNNSLFLALEVLCALLWFGDCLCHNVHEITGKVPFASGFAVLYLCWKFMPLVLRRLEVSSLNILIWHMMVTVEAAAVLMLAVILMVRKYLESNPTKY